MAGKAAIAVCMLAMVQPVFAEDLMDVYHKAMQNDPQILGAGYVHSAASESVNEARGRLLPQLGFEFSRSSNDQEIKQSDNPLYQQGKSKYYTNDYSLTLTQPLFDWALYNSYEQAKADVQRADAEFASKKQDAILRIAERYLEALAAADEVGLAEAEKAAVQKLLQLVEARMNGGIARRTELYDAQARYANVETDEISALSNQDDKLQALVEMVGELSGDLARLKSDIELVQPEPHEPESWMQAALKQNPRVVLQRRALDVSRREISIQKSGHFPTLSLTARLNNRDTGGTVFGGGNEVETGDVQLRVSVPIFQGGVVNSRTRRAQQLHQKARQDMTETQRAVQRAARAAYHGVIHSISKVHAAAKSVSSNELALQLKQRGYQSGIYPSLDVLDAERDTYGAKRDHARARYEFLLNSLRLKHAVGTLSETDIEGVNAWLYKTK